MSLLSLLPRESVERTARLVELALGTPVSLLAGSGGSAVSELPATDLMPGNSARAAALPGGSRESLQFCLASVSEGVSVRFSSDVATDREPLLLDGVRYSGARAYAVFPLTTAPSPGPELAAPNERVAMCILSDTPREWTERERRSLTTIAAVVTAELSVRRDLADNALREAEAREHALRDPLTGLPNRALFLDRLAHAVERGKRHKDFRFAVLALDLDRFKAVNDSLGHEAGNTVLAAVAARLLDCVRGEDMVARLSSDEFGLLLESLANDSDGGRVAERIQRSLAAAVPTDDGDVFTSASIGIVLSSPETGPPAQLVQRASIAMSRAKSSGRNRYEIFDRDMHARALARLRMETDLRRAVERSEFELHYQPLVTLSSGRITELEALLRWRHPTRGVVAPLDFIPLAEETGLILPIGAWVLGEACRQAVDWQRRFPRDVPLAVSVNLSVKQFAQTDFVSRVSDIVRTAGFDPHALKLEITESFAIDDAERTRTMLEELRALGIRIYLDDFGTGYSSLGYLQRLPLDAIKIDRTFVMRMDAGPTQLQLVHTVRELARNIGVAAVAEGVETPAQLETLRSLGCESAQGYLFSRPLPARDMATLLAHDPRW
ncbi:MAG: hypothetical protein NVS4B3_27960 [Gemmatimonadaceae bacterium]